MVTGQHDVTRAAGDLAWVRAGVERVHRGALHVLVGGVGLLFVFPFVWMIFTSLKAPRELYQLPPTFFPQTGNLHNYVVAVTYIPFLRDTLNTLFIASVSVLGTLLSCSLVAFSFSRVRWHGRDALFILVLSTMLLPGPVTLIPRYIIFKNLGWVGTFAPLTVPTFFGSAFYIFLLRQFFRTIPLELDEAARIDGAGYLTVFIRIVLPLSRPALAVLVILTFLDKWTDFFNPLIYLNNPATFTLSLGLQQFQSVHDTLWGPLMAASVLFMAPVIVLFMLTQKSLIQGITMSGLRG
jgi:multiple sugar transport system permease protein